MARPPSIDGAIPGLRTGRVLAGVAAFLALALAVGAIANLGPFAESDLSTTQFLLESDEICATAHDEFAEAQRSAPASAPAAVGVMQRLVDVARGELAAMRDLNAPATLAPAVDRYLAARERGITVLERGLAAAERKDAADYSQAQAELQAGQAERLELARRVGFRECSRSLGA